MKIVGLMLVKSRSSRLPSKNTYPFKGKVMFLHNLQKCLKIFDEVYVSSESEDILDLADAVGGIAIKRPKELCGSTPNILVYKHALPFMGDIDGFVAVQANSPTIKSVIIRNCKEALEEYKEVMTKHLDGSIYGSVWAMTTKKLAEYTEPYDYFNPTPEKMFLDESVDIHTEKDLQKALEQI